MICYIRLFHVLGHHSIINQSTGSLAIFNPFVSDLLGE